MEFIRIHTEISVKGDILRRVADIPLWVNMRPVGADIPTSEVLRPAQIFQYRNTYIPESLIFQPRHSISYKVAYAPSIHLKKTDMFGYLTQSNGSYQPAHLCRLI